MDEPRNSSTDTGILTKSKKEKENATLVPFLIRTQAHEIKSIIVTTNSIDMYTSRLDLLRCFSLSPHRWAVTNVSMNLKPSNLGANFSLFDDDICKLATSFCTDVDDDRKQEQIQLLMEEGLEAWSGWAVVEDDVRATVDAASTEATRMQEPFISSPSD